MAADYPIDLVVTYVDNTDPVWLAAARQFNAELRKLPTAGSSVPIMLSEKLSRFSTIPFQSSNAIPKSLALSVPTTSIGEAVVLSL